MTEKNIFEIARNSICEQVIRRLFDHNGSKQRKRELQIKCPYRSDKSIGSFEINLDTGLWIDYIDPKEEKGDLIDLLVKTYRIKKKEAAEKIIDVSGGVIPDKKNEKQTQDYPEYEAVIPIPEKKLRELNDHIDSHYILKKFGETIDCWIMKMPDGKAWQCLNRHFKNGKKKDIPYKFCTDGKWHAGIALKKNAFLYNIEKIKPDSKILIVEGLKCARVDVPGWVVLSWHGGGGGIDHYNWKFLKNHEKIIIWPDLDKKYNNDGQLMPDNQQPGLKNAWRIQEKLKQAKILDVYKKFGTGKPDGWDIFDAKEEGIDLVKFIQECEIYEDKIKDDKENKINNRVLETVEATSGAQTGSNCNYFKCLGFDSSKHYFLPKGSNIVKTINFGAFTRVKLNELAPLSYWTWEYPQKKGFDFECAVDDLIRQSNQKGYFRPDTIRGTGIWLDENRIIINNGEKIFDENGEEIKNIKTNFAYVLHEKRLGEITGRACTTEEGYKLQELFVAQGFEKSVEALICLGWALIAPLGGLLKWRPHIWIIGPHSAGKSWIQQYLILPICGPFAFIGSGADSGPGLYRSLGQTPCPVLKDEMEGASKEAKRKVMETLEILRNASSDFSATKTIADQSGGAIRFCIRSLFCLSSIVADFNNPAIESRVMFCKIKAVQEGDKTKYEKTKEILKTGIMKDPGIFRRKILKNIRSFLKNIDFLENIIWEETGEKRKADNLAPILSALHCLVDPGEMTDKEKIKEYVNTIINQIEKKEKITDEDKILRELFDRTLPNKKNEQISIAELIVACQQFPDNLSDERTLLARNGIRIYERNGVKYLAIAVKHRSLSEILKDTMYSSRYSDVLERHPAALPRDEKTNRHISVKMAEQTKDCVHLRWQDIKDIYFEDDNETDIFEIF